MGSNVNYATRLDTATPINRLTDQQFVMWKWKSPCLHYAAAPCQWPTGLWVRRCCFAVDACAGGTCPLRPAAPQFLLYSRSDTDLNSAGATPGEARGHYKTIYPGQIYGVGKVTERLPFRTAEMLFVVQFLFDFNGKLISKMEAAAFKMKVKIFHH